MYDCIRSVPRDTISVRCVTHSVLLTGVGVYNTMGSGGEVMVCVDARPLEDNPRPIDCKTLLKVVEQEHIAASW